MSAPARCAASAASALHALAAEVGRAATVALYDELALAPKPGLVSFVDNGSHDDMDARTFMRSIFALRRVFPHFAELGAHGAAFTALEQAGIAAEARMLRATGGVNTHRGAIFTLGLLCAAAGRLLERGDPIAAQPLRRALIEGWADALAARAQRKSNSHGALAACRFGLRSAGIEAAMGFPVLFETALPALRDALRRGLSQRQARTDAFFATMAVLDDTNIVHRGGLAGLRFAQRESRRYMAAGGAGRPDATAHAQSLHRAFVSRRLSPGGAADVLAAACWLQRVCDAR